jgi:hypothetical protein
MTLSITTFIPITLCMVTFSIMVLRKETLRIKTPSILKLRIMILNILTFIIVIFRPMTLCMMTLSIMTLIIMKQSTKTPSTLLLRIKTLNIITLISMTFGKNTQYNGT